MEVSDAEGAVGVRLENLESAQITRSQPRVQARHERQQLRERLTRVRMNHEQSFEISSCYLLNELAHQRENFAVRLERIVHRKRPNLEADRLPEARGPSERTHRESTEDLVRLLDELLGPSDHRIDDIAFRNRAG